MRIPVRIKWIETKNQWHMEAPDGTFLQEFFGCGIFTKVFQGADKQSSKMYIIEVTPMEKSE